jgi:hypothetical protein
VLDTAEGFVAVSWRLPTGTLSMAFNIGEQERALPAMPGETIFAWPESTDVLPQNAIVVRLAAGEPK